MIVIRDVIKCPDERLRGLERDTVVLRWYERQKSRQKLKTTKGVQIYLVLPRGTILKDGDILYKDARRYIVVEAAKEMVIAITTEDKMLALRMAYELGNRHLPISIVAGCLLVPYERSTEELIKRFGIRYELKREQFEPLKAGNHHEHGTY